MTGGAVDGNVAGMAGLGVYPGSFNPPTRAHIEIAITARRHHRLERVDLVVSTNALGKEGIETPSFEHRLEVLRETVADLPGLRVQVTEAQMIVDIAVGYDVVVMGADKWAQVNDAAWYADEAERDRALGRLPVVALAPRPPHHVPPHLTLPVAADLIEISSSAVRAGRVDWMTAAAARFDGATGAWTDEARYQRWLAEHS